MKGFSKPHKLTPEMMEQMLAQEQKAAAAAKRNELVWVSSHALQGLTASGFDIHADGVGGRPLIVEEAVDLARAMLAEIDDKNHEPITGPDVGR